MTHAQLFAALAERKPFMYCVADNEGRPIMDDICVGEHPSELVECFQDQIDNLTAKIVPVYTGPQIEALLAQVARLEVERNDAVSQTAAEIYARQKAESDVTRMLIAEGELRRERDRLASELSRLRGIAESSAQSVGVDYVTHRDETVAVIARELAAMARECDRLAAQVSQPIILTRRHLKSRAISDYTFSEHAEGWDAAMSEIEEQLTQRGIVVQRRDWMPTPPEKETK